MDMLWNAFKYFFFEQIIAFTVFSGSTDRAISNLNYQICLKIMELNDSCVVIAFLRPPPPTCLFPVSYPVHLILFK